MSSIRFVIYFLALSAGSTVMFASDFMGQASAPVINTQEFAQQEAFWRVRSLSARHAVRMPTRTPRPVRGG